MMTLLEFERHLATALVSVKPQLEVGLDKVGTLAVTLAAHYPGEYQEGWAKLAPSTIKDKEAKGYPVPSPLKRTGEMASSYKKELMLGELAVVVGSSEKTALWQEMGTSRGIPPRPVVGKAMQNSLPYAAETFGEIALGLMTGKAPLLK